MNGFVLHLQGPLMSFADRGFGQLREEGDAPSRSAVIGIIAAAIGLERGSPDLLELHQHLRVHVAQVRAGALLVDYHTILTAGYDDYDPAALRREGAKGNPILTWRSYHSDAHFIVLVEGEASTVQRAAEGLRAPVFTTYIGRRSCPPSIPLLPIDIEGDDVADVLANAYNAWLDEKRDTTTGELPWHIRKRLPDALDFWIDGSNAPASCAHIATGYRRDLLSALPRYHVNRPVTHARYPIEHPQTQNEEFYHDAS